MAVFGARSVVMARRVRDWHVTSSLHHHGPRSFPSIPSHPIPPHLIPSHPIPSQPIATHLNPIHPVLAPTPRPTPPTVLRFTSRTTHPSERDQERQCRTTSRFGLRGLLRLLQAWTGSAHVCSRVLLCANVCSCLLRCAHVCSCVQAAPTSVGIQSSHPPHPSRPSAITYRLLLIPSHPDQARSHPDFFSSHPTPSRPNPDFFSSHPIPTKCDHADLFSSHPIPNKCDRIPSLLQVDELAILATSSSLLAPHHPPSSPSRAIVSHCAFCKCKACNFCHAPAPPPTPPAPLCGVDGADGPGVCCRVGCVSRYRMPRAPAPCHELHSWVRGSLSRVTCPYPVSRATGRIFRLIHVTLPVFCPCPCCP